MTWPAGAISTANLDAGSDSISAARADLYQMAVKVNMMIDNGATISDTPNSYGNANVAAYLPTYQGQFSNLWVTGTNTTNLIKNTTQFDGPVYFTATTAPYPVVFYNSVQCQGLLDVASLNINNGTSLGSYIERIYTIGNSGSGTVTPYASNGAVQKLTATGNFTLAAPSGMSAGSSIVLIIRQDSTGSRVPTINSAYKFAAGQKTLSTAGLSVDMITIFYDGSDYLCNLIKAYS
jgi:hypothetical protein